MIGRIVRPADFERVLAAPQRSRSAHFAVHHLGTVASSSSEAGLGFSQETSVKSLPTELSTGGHGCPPVLVDERRMLGLVVPKRHAKRAVTRNLIKRQVRAVVAECASSLPPGWWVVRLKAPFDSTRFDSPASDGLRAAARHELVELMRAAVLRPLRPHAKANASSARTGKPSSKSKRSLADPSSQAASSAPAQRVTDLVQPGRGAHALAAPRLDLPGSDEGQASGAARGTD